MFLYLKKFNDLKKLLTISKDIQEFEKRYLENENEKIKQKNHEFKKDYLKLRKSE